MRAVYLDAMTPQAALRAERTAPRVRRRGHLARGDAKRGRGGGGLFVHTRGAPFLWVTAEAQRIWRLRRAGEHAGGEWHAEWLAVPGLFLIIKEDAEAVVHPKLDLFDDYSPPRAG